MSILAFNLCGYFRLAAGNNLQISNCPIWHVRRADKCECGDIIYGCVVCNVTNTVTVSIGHCMT